MSETQISGSYFAAQHNGVSGGMLGVATDGTTRFIPKSGASFYVGKFRDAAISDRIGSIPRRITFADGSTFETTDNDGVDRLELALGTRTKLGHGLSAVNRLEQSARLAVLSALLVLVVGAATYWYGVPAAADILARKLPDDILDKSAEVYTEQLVEKRMKPSNLPTAQQAHIMAEFERLIGLSQSPYDYRLVFRNAGKMANAFALPDGTIVVTDELVKLSTGDEQVVAVLAHEIGHVDERHAVRQVLQASALSVVLLALTGDSSGVADLMVNAPAVLILTANSRAFEREADRFAINLLQDAGISPHHLADMLDAMGQSCGEKCAGGGFLDTHPANEERGAYLRGAARP